MKFSEFKYECKLMIHRNIFDFALRLLRYMEIRHKPRYNKEYLDLIKKSKLFKTTNSELHYVSLLSQLEKRYILGDYHSTVSKKIEIYQELYAKQSLGKDYYPSNLGSIWTNVVGHEAQIGSLKLCSKYKIIQEGKRNIDIAHTKKESLLLSLYDDFLNVNYSTRSLIDVSYFPSQFYRYEDLNLWKTKDSFEDYFSVLDRVFQMYDSDPDAFEFVFSPEVKESYFKKLESLGLPKKAWFVVVHVKETPKNANQRRSASVQNFDKSCRYITSQDGWVIQIGFKDSTKLNLDKNFIDLRGESIDRTNLHIFVLANAKFFLGTMSGLSPTTALFKTPMLITNSVTLGTLTINYNSLTRFLPKTVLHIDTKRKLSFREILDSCEGFGEMHTTDLKKKSLCLIENSAQEIYDATLDFFSVLSSNPKQKNNNLIGADQISKIRCDYPFTSTGSFSESYLSENPDWFKHE